MTRTRAYCSHNSFCKSKIFRLAVAVRYNPKIELTDQRRPPCLKRGYFVRCFFRRAAVRARSDNAAEHCRGRDPHNRWIELNSADQCRDEGHTACRDRDPSGQDEFAATLDLGGELIYFRLQPLNLVPGITFIHDGHAGER